MSPTCIEVRHPCPERTEVWLNRPEVRKAFNDAMIAELTQAFTDIARDPQVRVVLLTGHGKAFCAGADLNWMRAMADYSWDQNCTDAQGLADMLWALDQCPVPIVGRLQGDCYAGGMGLASVCDVRLASASMQFCLSEARLGLMPATISPYVVRAMGASAARRYFVTAERFTASQAQAMGLVHEVCAPDALDASVEAMLETVVQNGPAAVRLCKQLVRDVESRPIDADLRAETARRIADIRASDEGKEGLQSFLNKRPPNWLIPRA